MRSDPRAVAAKVVANVLAGRSLTDSLQRLPDGLNAKDRPLVAELSYGVCRWFVRLDFQLSQLMHKGLKRRDNDIRCLLMVGLYQLQYTRVPAHAAVGETAGAARSLRKNWAVRLINGVLRQYQREDSRMRELADAEPATRYALPRWLVDRLLKDWPDNWKNIAATLVARPPMTLRVNLAKISREEYLKRLADEGFEATAHELAVGACTLARPVPVEQLPGFADGLVSVQDAGAQMAAPLLAATAGQRVLDACAAPGGKTGHLLELTPDLDLVAVDVDSQRLARVEENLQRLGQQAQLICADISSGNPEWAGGQYDRILLDVPCSATGVMRRHPDIKLLRRESDIGELARKQQQILETVWPLLKPGGKLLYVTCSILNEENRMQVERFLYNHKEARLQELKSIPSREEFGDWRIAPGYLGMDGFYFALLGKIS